MKIRWAIAIVGTLALAALTITTQMPWLTEDHPEMQEAAAPPASAAPAAEGEAAPLTCPADAKPAKMDFSLKTHDGQTVTLSQHKGKVILLDFWATWCGPCKVEIPHFIEFQEKYGPRGFQVLGVSVDDTPDLLKPYVAAMKMNYPVLLGLGRDDLQSAFGPTEAGFVGIPVTVLISRDARICATHTGLTGKDVFEREIQALL